MARAPNEKVQEAQVLYKSGIPLVEIAEKLGVPAGTVRRWKSTYKWDSERSDKCERSHTKKNAVTELLESDLTDKQKLFCIHYIKCFNATKAYQKAYGCGYETAMSEGSKNLGNPKIAAEITRLKQHKLNQAFLAPEDIFQKYMDIAFADITDFLEFGREEVPVMGPFGPIELKDDETGEKISLTKTVNVVRFKESSEIDGTIIGEVKQGKDGASIKLQDRMKALQWLTDHMDIATEEQKARIAVLKAKAQLGESGQTEDDGFMDALAGKVDEVWQEE